MGFQVQQLLLKECRLIYECKLCRNMFRNLTQFIGHKREFCRSAVHCDGDISEVDKYNGFAVSNWLNVLIIYKMALMCI